MNQRTQQKFYEISIALSFASMVVTIIINIQIAKQYLKSDGKTRGLFGINELLQFGYQYYLVLLGVASFVFALLGIGKSLQKRKILIAALLSLISIVTVFLRIWRIII
jgi:hypothetical protein